MQKRKMTENEMEVIYCKQHKTVKQNGSEISLHVHFKLLVSLEKSASCLFHCF